MIHSRKGIHSSSAETIDHKLHQIDQVREGACSSKAISLEVVWHSFGEKGKINLWKDVTLAGIEGDQESGGDEICEHELGKRPVLHSFAYAGGVIVQAVMHLIVLPSAVEIVEQLKGSLSWLVIESKRV